MKNASIDLLKGISCIVVVWLHCRFPGLFGDAVIYALRFSLPIFFMVSGYYSRFRDEKWIVGKMKQILRMLLLSEGFYGVWTVTNACIIHHIPPGVFAAEYFSEFHPVRVLFFGTMFNDVLWYLYAVFWAWGIFWLMRRSGTLKRCYALIIPLLVIHICGRIYLQNHIDFGTGAVFWFRSALLFALPMMLIGSFFAEYSETIAAHMSRIRAAAVIGAGVVLLAAEYLLSGQYMDLHFSTVLISAGMFLYAQISPDTGRRKLFRPITYIGGRLYMYIYLYHMFVISLAELAEEKLKLGGAVWGWSKPVLTVFCSVAAAQFWLWIKYKMIRKDRI